MTIHPCRLPRVARSGALINTPFSWPNGLVRPIWERLQSHMLSGVELVPLRARTPGREEKDESIPMAKKAQEVRGDAKEEALAAQGNRRSFTFSDLDDAVDARERDFFAETAGPENFQLVDFGGGAEAEMDT